MSPSRTVRASASVKAARDFLALDGRCDRYLIRHRYEAGSCTRCLDKRRCRAVWDLAWAAQQERDRQVARVLRALIREGRLTEVAA